MIRRRAVSSLGSSLIIFHFFRFLVIMSIHASTKLITDYRFLDVLSVYCINFKKLNKNYWRLEPGTQSAVRQTSNAASVDWSCECEPLSGQTFHQYAIHNHCPGSSRAVVSYWRNMYTLGTGRRYMLPDNVFKWCLPIYIYIFSKQSFNESLDFYNRS